jgi:UDP:flavonoid glycosyltransferase YjiC (YdhE family)
MKRILLVAEAVTLAHMARCVVLADYLHQTGKYQVALAADGRYDAVIGPVAYARMSIYSIPSPVFFAKLAKGSVLYDKKTLCRYVEDDLKIIEDYNPDFIIGDFRLSLAISARLAGIPYATITNAYWSPYADIQYTIPDIGLAHWLGVNLAQKLFDWVRPLVFILHAIPFNQTCKAYGLPPVKYDMREVYTHADYTLYADMESVVKVHSLPDNHLFIGPVLWSASVALPDWWNQWPTDQPVVFVTLGSSGNASLLPLILEVLSQMPVTVLCVSAGYQTATQNYQNIYRADFLPAEQAVKKADIVICNGGSPMVYQGLIENKAIIGIPGNLDQYLMMTWLEQSGRGILVRSGQMSQKTLKNAMNQVLEQRNTSRPFIDQDFQPERLDALITEVLS